MAAFLPSSCLQTFFPVNNLAEISNWTLRWTKLSWEIVPATSLDGALTKDCPSHCQKSWNRWSLKILCNPNQPLSPCNLRFYRKVVTSPNLISLLTQYPWCTLSWFIYCLYKNLGKNFGRNLVLVGLWVGVASKSWALRGHCIASVPQCVEAMDSRLIFSREIWPRVVYSPACLPIFPWQPFCSLLGFLSNFSLGNFSLFFFSLNLNVKGRTFKEWYNILDCVWGQKNRLNIVLEILFCPIFHHSMSLRQKCNFSETFHGSIKNELNSPSSPARISIKL